MTITIRINHAENNAVAAGTYSVTEARSLCHAARFRAPQGGGYDKVDFTLVEGDEDVFTGRLDIEHIDRPGNGDADPVAHVRRWAEFCLSDRGRAFFANHPYPVAEEDARAVLEVVARAELETDLVEEAEAEAAAVEADSAAMTRAVEELAAGRPEEAVLEELAAALRTSDPETIVNALYAELEVVDEDAAAVVRARVWELIRELNERNAR